MEDSVVYDPESLVARRELRRRLSYWRVGAVLCAGLAIVAGAYALGAPQALQQSHHIARITVSGAITGNRDLLETFERVGKSRADAVIIAIDSPGGTTAGSEALYTATRRLAAKKPVVAVVRSVGASGGYMTALGADHIVAQGSAVVGSIGVIAQYPNVAGLLDKVGVKFEAVRSAPLKAQPSGFEPTSPEARVALTETVMESFAWFKDLVRDRRKLSDPEADGVSDGRVFSGRQALKLKLIDQVGDETDAVAWLETNRQLRRDLPIRDYKPQDRLSGLGVVAQALATIGLEAMGRAVFAENSTAHTLDGLMSIWQPQN